MHASPAPGVTLRAVDDVTTLAMCEEIEAQVWGIDDREVVPASHLSAVAHAGGLVAGAFDGDRMAGFAYGFLSSRNIGGTRSWGMHSHLLAVLPPYRAAGVGRALKWFQRDWCLERDLSWITWTFDPLQSRNARLNLEHLGAYASEYRIDAYGLMGGNLNAELPTDRLVATWDLLAPNVRALAGGAEPPPVPEPALSLLRRGDRNEPLRAPLADGAAGGERVVRLEIPPNILEVLLTDPASALAWRFELRTAMREALGAGYVVRRFVDGAYLLERPPRAPGSASS